MVVKDFLDATLPKVHVPTMNRGGCGIFALLLTEHLYKLSIPYNILVYTDDHCANDVELERYINTNGDAQNICGVSHIVVQIDDYYVDSYGIVDLPKRITAKILIGREKLQDLVDTVPIWNSTFDRSLVPSIKQKLSEVMQPLYSPKIGEENVFMKYLNKLLKWLR